METYRFTYIRRRTARLEDGGQGSSYVPCVFAARIRFYCNKLQFAGQHGRPPPTLRPSARSRRRVQAAGLAPADGWSSSRRTEYEVRRPEFAARNISTPEPRPTTYPASTRRHARHIRAHSHMLTTELPRVLAGRYSTTCGFDEDAVEVRAAPLRRVDLDAPRRAAKLERARRAHAGPLARVRRPPTHRRAPPAMGHRLRVSPR